jgi:hypothetical protein
VRPGQISVADEQTVDVHVEADRSADAARGGGKLFVNIVVGTDEIK